MRTQIKEVKYGFKCNQNWSEMQGSENLKHCSLCTKSVYNLEVLSDGEIVEFLNKRGNQGTCARIRKEQLDRINVLLRNNPEYRSDLIPFIAALVTTTLISCSSAKTFTHESCNHTESKMEIVSTDINPDSLNTTLIRGIMIDEKSEPLIGANINLDSSSIGCITNMDGKFQIRIDNSDLRSKTFTAQYLGYDDLQLKLSEVRNNEVKITMAESMVILGEVVVVKYPLHKRMWHGIKSIFGKG